jgi:hypothetical protein
MQSPTHDLAKGARDAKRHTHRSEFFMTIFGIVTVLYRTSVYTRNPILFRDTHARGVRFTAASVSTRGQ